MDFSEHVLILTFHFLNGTSRKFRNKNNFSNTNKTSLLFKFDLEDAIKRVQVNQDVLKLNGTLQLLVYADDGNILSRSVHTMKKNVEALVVGNKEIELEVGAEKTKQSAWSCLEITMKD